MPPLFSSVFNKLAQRAGTGVDAPVNEAGHTLLFLSAEKGDAHAVARLLRLGASPRQLDGNGQTPLYAAVAAHDIALVKMMVARGGSFTAEDDGGNTPLQWAIQNKADVTFIEDMRALGMELDFRGDSGRRALHAAARGNNIEVLSWLLQKGVPIDAIDAEGKSALHIAAGNGAHEAMRLLIENGADPVLCTTEIKTPLYFAAAKGDEAAANILLDIADVRQTLNEYRSYKEGYSPLMAAVVADKGTTPGNYVAVAERLIDLGAYINEADNTKRHSLFIAAEQATPAMVAMLIRRGADVAKAPVLLDRNLTIMHRIGSAFYKEKLQMLVEAGGDINARDSSGNTPLHNVADASDVAKTRALLELGADPNPLDGTGRRPLDRAVANCSYYYSNSGSSQVVAALLDGGASPDISPGERVVYAPLHVVARSTMLPAIAAMKMLIDHGAVIDVPDRLNGATPWLRAADVGNLDACEALRQKGANTSVKDKTGQSIIHYAARSGSISLLEAGLRNPVFKGQADAPDLQGNRPLHFAAKAYFRPDCARILLAAGADPLAFDGAGLTPLHYLMRHNSDVMFALFEKALDPNKTDPNKMGQNKEGWNIRTRDDNKQTPLHIAIKAGYYETFDRLMKHDPDIALQDNKGHTPLMAAVAAEQSSIMRALIAAMKLKNIPIDTARDAAGLAAVHLAVGAIYSPLSATATLLDAGANINLRTLGGDTPLHLAVAKGRSDLVDILVRRGASLALVNNAGQTPADIARTIGRQDIAVMLQKALQEQQKKEAENTTAPGGATPTVRVPPTVPRPRPTPRPGP